VIQIPGNCAPLAPQLLCPWPRPVVLELYKHTEPLHSFPSFCRTPLSPNVAESKNGLGLRVSDDLRRIPNMVPLNPRGSIELSLKTTGLDSVVSV